MNRTYQDQTVIITGATGGFGSTAARRFHAEGARLVLCDLDRSKLEDLSRELGGTDIEILAGSVAEEQVSADLVALSLSRFGRLDIAINNAGIAYQQKKLPDIASDEARKVMDINLMGMFYALKHQLPQMEKQFRETGTGGTIVNLASIAGVVGAPGGSIYAASKHAVVGLTKSAAIEYARRGIRINALCPSYARTPMVTGNLFGEPKDPDALAKAEADLVRGIPMRRLAEVDEIMEALFFIASPANSFMTGQTIQVDGGLTAF